MPRKSAVLGAYESRAIACELRSVRKQLIGDANASEASFEKQLRKLAIEAHEKPGRILCREHHLNINEARIDAVELDIMMAKNHFNKLMPVFRAEKQKLASANTLIEVAFTYNGIVAWVENGSAFIARAFVGKLRCELGKDAKPETGDRAVDAIALALRRELKGNAKRNHRTK